VAQVLYKEVISRYGVIRELLSDRGSSFRNRLIVQLCKLLNIKHRFTSPHHPQTDGKAERMIQTVVRSMKLACKDQSEWADKITPVLMSYKATISSSIGTSPFYAMCGREVRLGIDVNLLQEFEKAPDIQVYMTNLVPKLKLTHEMIQQNLRGKNIVAKQYYDKESTEVSLQIGDKVLLHDPTTRIGECPKLKKRWVGPYLLTHKSQDDLTFRLRHCVTGKELRFTYM